MIKTKTRLMKILVALNMSLGLTAFSTGAQATYPDKPVKIIVAFPPGSSTDTVARLMAQQMSVAFGQAVVVENRPGASGNIATTFVSKLPGDGYTLLMHSVAIAVNPSLYAKAGYDVNKDLEAVAITGVSPNIFFVHPDVKAKTLAELVALSKNEKLSYASSGNGTTTHLGAEIFFRNLVKSDIQHVPYAPATAVTAVLSGQVPVGSTSVPPVVQLANSGKVRALAVTSSKRSSERFVLVAAQSSRHRVVDERLPVELLLQLWRHWCCSGRRCCVPFWKSKRWGCGNNPAYWAARLIC